MSKTAAFPMSDFPTFASCTFDCAPWNGGPDPTDDSYPCVTATGYTLPILNPGAENGMTDWVDNGMNSWTANSPVAPAGTKVFSGENSSIGGTAHQDVSIPVSLQGIEYSYISWEWLQGSYATDEDNAAVHMTFLDSSDVEISTSRSILRTVITPNSYEKQYNQAWIPTTAAKIRVLLESERGSASNYGSNANGSIDSVAAIIYYDFTKTLSSVSLTITNGDATSGTTGWTVTSAGVTSATYLTKTCFYGGNSDAYSEMYQDITLAIGTLTTTIIDEGESKFKLEWAATRYTADDQGDKTRIRLQFFDGSSVELADYNLGWQHPRGWKYASRMLDIPATARTVRLTVYFSRLDGANNNAYVTDFVATGYHPT